jgi:heptosyltransferase II
MAQSLFMTLRQRYPEAAIDVLAPAWTAPLLARMPEVRHHIEMPVDHGALGLGTRWRIGRRLRGERYEQAVVLPRSFKAALVPFFAKVPRRIGYLGESRYRLINDIRPLDTAVLTQTVQRYVALGIERGAPLPPEVPQPRLETDPDNQTRLLQDLALSTDRPIVGLMPGAEYGPAKRWPAEKYAELARRLVKQGSRVWLFGSTKDQKVCREIVERTGGSIVDLSGKTRLEDAIDLIALVDQVVTNDSGLMHIAAATGRRLVAIYGSSSPAFTPPLTDLVEVLTLGLECSPCFERECPLGHLNCLRQIEVDSVVDAIERVVRIDTA